MADDDDICDKSFESIVVKDSDKHYQNLPGQHFNVLEQLQDYF